MNVQVEDFQTFKDYVNTQGQDGIVLMGCGGDPNEWAGGVADLLHKEEIVTSADPTEVWNEAFLLTTTGGRTDIALTFNPNMKFNYNKMALWRLRMGDCSWIMDYVVNYTDQHQV